MCRKSESSFWVHTEKHRNGRLQIFLRTGSIQTRVNHDDLAKLKDILNKIDVIESCSRRRMNIKWKFYS